jgi:hypothetical protein
MNVITINTNESYIKWVINDNERRDMRKKKEGKNWRLFRVKGIIATAKEIARDTDYTNAHLLVDTAENLYYDLKENRKEKYVPKL